VATGSVDAEDASKSSSAMIDLWSAQERDIRKLQQESKKPAAYFELARGWRITSM